MTRAKPQVCFHTLNKVTANISPIWTDNQYLHHQNPFGAFIYAIIFPCLAILFWIIHLQCFPVRCKNTITQRPKPLHLHWVTSTKYHLLWYRSLSQTPCRITEMLIILLAVFLHKQEQAHAKMFRGVISMLLWSGVCFTLWSFVYKHIHREGEREKRETHTLALHHLWRLEIGGSCRFIVGSLARSLCYCWRPATASLSALMTCYIRAAQQWAPASN